MTRPQNPLDMIERAEAAGAELREIVREAHGLTRDLRRLVTEARAAVGAIEAEIDRTVRELIETTVATQLKEMGERTAEAMAASADKVGVEFEKLAGIFLGRNRNKMLELYVDADAKRLEQARAAPPSHHCWDCGDLIEFGNELTPSKWRPGNAVVCSHCGALHLLTRDGRKKAPTLAQMTELEASPDIAEMLEAARGPGNVPAAAAAAWNEDQYGR